MRWSVLCKQIIVFCFKLSTIQDWQKCIQMMYDKTQLTTDCRCRISPSFLPQIEIWWIICNQHGQHDNFVLISLLKIFLSELSYFYNLFNWPSNRCQWYNCLHSITFHFQTLNICILGILNSTHIFDHFMIWSVWLNEAEQNWWGPTYIMRIIE